MKFTLTPYHFTIIRVFADYPYQIVDTLAPIVARGKTAPKDSWAQKKLKELVGYGYLGFHDSGFGVPRIYYPLKAALDALHLDQSEKQSLLNKASHIDRDWESVRRHELPLAFLHACIMSLHLKNQIRHKMYYAKHRFFPLEGRFYNPRRDRWVSKNANTDGFYVWENKPFDRNIVRNLFVESDTGRTNLTRSDMERGSSILRHLEVYLSLLKEPFRLSPFRIARFGVLIVRPDLREGSDLEDPDVFFDNRLNNIVDLLSDRSFDLLRRHVYFTHAGLLVPGEHVRVQNWQREWVFLTK
jgi:hypothetical protein